MAQGEEVKEVLHGDCGKAHGVGVKRIVAQANMLTNIRTGMHTVWTWFDDGTCEEREAPLGPIQIPKQPLQMPPGLEFLSMGVWV